MDNEPKPISPSVVGELSEQQKQELLAETTNLRSDFSTTILDGVKQGIIKPRNPTITHNSDPYFSASHDFSGISREHGGQLSYVEAEEAIKKGVDGIEFDLGDSEYFVIFRENNMQLTKMVYKLGQESTGDWNKREEFRFNSNGKVISYANSSRDITPSVGIHESDNSTAIEGVSKMLTELKSRIVTQTPRT